jgi:hypothetical protein
MTSRCRWKLIAVSLAAAMATSPAGAATTLFVHGHIYTGNPKEAWAQALAVDGERIIAVGSDSDVRRVAGRPRTVVDLKGHTVVPGIVDSHLHMLYGAYALHGVNLSTPAASVTAAKPDLLVARLRDYAAAHPQDKVIFARADFGTVPPATPGTELLDRAVPDRPVVVHNTSEHALWLNRAAFAMAGIGDWPVGNPDEERGILRDASGHPLGVVLEGGMDVIARAVAGHVPTEDKLAMLREASAYLNSFGITTVVNATGNLAELRLYAALRDRGELTVRTRTAFGAVAVPHRLTPEFLADLEEARRSYHDDWVAANLVKFFADGSTGLIPPLVYEPHAYEALVLELDRRGFQLMTHAIRSDSARLALDAYRKIVEQHGPRDRRLRIEHADVVEPADVPRFGALGVIADMQPSFCCGEDGLNYDMAHPVTTDRWKGIADGGAALAFSSDWPCTWPPDPFVAMQEAVTREVWKSADTADVSGQPLDGAGQGGAVTTGASYTPEERVSVGQALDAYTRGGAYASFFDTRVGTLEAGKAADFVILSQDLFAAAPGAIARTSVLATYVAGRRVYGSPP